MILVDTLTAKFLFVLYLGTYPVEVVCCKHIPRLALIYVEVESDLISGSYLVSSTHGQLSTRLVMWYLYFVGERRLVLQC